MNYNTLLFGALAAFALAGGAGAYGQTAPPPVTWNVSGVLNDGGNVIGYFTQDTYDYLAGGFSFVTSGPSLGTVTFANNNVASLDTSSSAVSVGNTSQYHLTLNFAHDLLTPAANPFIGTESYNGTSVAVAGTALAAPSPMAGGGLVGLFAAASVLLWRTRRRASAFAGAFAARQRLTPAKRSPFAP